MADAINPFRYVVWLGLGFGLVGRSALVSEIIRACPGGGMILDNVSSPSLPPSSSLSVSQYRI